MGPPNSNHISFRVNYRLLQRRILSHNIIIIIIRTRLAVAPAYLMERSNVSMFHQHITSPLPTRHRFRITPLRNRSLTAIHWAARCKTVNTKSLRSPTAPLYQQQAPCHTRSNSPPGSHHGRARAPASIYKRHRMAQPRARRTDICAASARLLPTPTLSA